MLYISDISLALPNFPDWEVKLINMLSAPGLPRAGRLNFPSIKAILVIHKSNNANDVRLGCKSPLLLAATDLRPGAPIMKRACSPETSPEHELNKGIPLNRQHPVLLSLDAPVSPPRKRSSIKLAKGGGGGDTIPPNVPQPNTSSGLAAIEAGQVKVTDHLNTISARLKECVRPLPKPPIPRLPINDWVKLYKRNEHPEGRHFVIHQHDHPIAGPHYDLRLQFSETSSVSWSIMYGLPGDPNSQRLNRNATETRVHCLWVSL